MVGFTVLVYRVIEGLPDWVSLEVRNSKALSDAELERLHAFANVMAAEDAAHFARHLRTNHEVHFLTDRRSGNLAGFQAWRSEPLGEDRRLLIGGKLRMHPAYRGRGLHLLSGLRFYANERERYPGRYFDRVAIANLFGFSTLVRNLSHYTIFDPRDELHGIDRQRFDQVAAITAQSGYQLDPITGYVHVGIRMTEAQLFSYPDAFYQSDAAKMYFERIPDARSSDCQLAIWFPFDDANLRSLRQGAQHRLCRPAPVFAP